MPHPADALAHIRDEFQAVADGIQSRFDEFAADLMTPSAAPRGERGTTT